ncbi:MAG: MBOAT family protein [bacterium]|nr:MBOAT family protein [bacterium]
MVFTSQVFLFYFLPLFLAGYYVLPRAARNGFLAAASYLFYGWWSPWFVTLMLFSTVVDWACGVAVTAEGASERKRKGAVFVSVATNLALLGFFKYFVFVQDNWNRLAELFGVHSIGVLEVVLPVGISFYSFQSMSYTVDLYRGHAQRARRFGDFACYVAMFPQLVAGPIVRYREIAAQLAERPQRGELFAEGVLYFMVGFAKKVLIANTIGEVADLCFDAGALAPGLAWFGLLAYAFQIYFDFSGYSDMAIGLGLFLGFRLPTNFRSPYRAESITDLWRRWHVSLSTWLRDYLYIPLGGSRGGRRKTYRNLMLTMLLGGLWHGAQWTFLVWGALHGALLAFERMRGKRAVFHRLPRSARIAVTFSVVLFTWVPFRARNLESALGYFQALFVPVGDGLGVDVLAQRIYRPEYFLALAAAAAITWFGVETQKLVESCHARRVRAVPVAATFLLAVVAMMAQAENPFLYFQF